MQFESLKFESLKLNSLEIFKRKVQNESGNLGRQLYSIKLNTQEFDLILKN